MSIKRSIAPLLLAFLLLLVYAPVFLWSYGFTDDYIIVQRVATGNLDRYISHIYGNARPSLAIIARVLYAHADSIDSLRFVRLFGVVGIILLGLLIFRFAVSTGWRVHLAFPMALVICTLPSFQVYAAWASAAPYPYSAMLACIAYILVRDIEYSQISAAWCLRILTAILIVGISFTIYQPTAMFFLVMIVIDFFGDKRKDYALSHMVFVIAIMFVGIGLGYLVARQSGALVTGRGQFTIDPVGKLQWFLDEPLINALNTIRIGREQRVTYSTVYILTVSFGLIRYYLRSDRRWRNSALLLPFPLLLLLPSMVVTESSATYRTLAPLAAFAVILFFVALRGLSVLTDRKMKMVSNFFAYLLATLALFFAINNIMVFFVIPQVSELNLVKRMLLDLESEQTEIHVIRPNWTDTAAPYVLYDEFGNVSTFMEYVPEPLFHALLSENNLIDSYDANIRVYPPYSYVEEKADTLIIDLGVLAIHEEIAFERNSSSFTFADWGQIPSARDCGPRQEFLRETDLKRRIILVQCLADPYAVFEEFVLSNVRITNMFKERDGNWNQVSEPYLEMQWLVDSQVDGEDWTVFVHFTDSSGQTLSQADHLLGLQANRTVTPPNEWGSDERIFTYTALPDDWTDYADRIEDVRIGIWNPTSSERLAPRPVTAELDSAGRLAIPIQRTQPVIQIPATTAWDYLLDSIHAGLEISRDSN